MIEPLNWTDACTCIKQSLHIHLKVTIFHQFYDTLHCKIYPEIIDVKKQLVAINRCQLYNTPNFRDAEEETKKQHVPKINDTDFSFKYS